MLGNESDARLIFEWKESQFLNGYSPAPRGWAYLGQGSFRSAYLSPDGVVYKVEHAPGGFYGQSNYGEMLNLRRYWLTKMPKGCRLPRWGWYPIGNRTTGVIAMEHFDTLLRSFSRYDANGAKYWDRLVDLQEALYDMYDLYGTNIAVDVKGDAVVPIDLGA